MSIGSVSSSLSADPRRFAVESYARSTPAPVHPAAPSVSAPADDLGARVQVAASRLQSMNQSLSFRVHEASGQLMVQIVDRNTGEVLREAPPAEFLDLAVRLHGMVEFFLDETR
ncbi:MAG: flagellar protein FlaG [Candidatus Eiseniibacteriota bacterium]